MPANRRTRPDTDKVKGATVRVRLLSSTEELQRYVDFGQDVYRDIPQWIPPDSHHMVELLSGNGGFGPDVTIQPFLIENDDRVLATITGVTSETYNQRWNERLGHLLFFEALPDQDEAVETLMRSAADWLRARDCQAMRMSLLPGMQLPLTIDAYDAVPTVFHTYNPSY